MYKIEVEKILGSELILRRSVSQLFQIEELMNHVLLVVDFKNISLMSRSFASEYLFYKNDSIYDVKEINVCEFVKKMLTVVQNTDLKKHVIDKNNIQKNVFN